MADIKNLAIFGNSNRGLDKIKQQSKEKEEAIITSNSTNGRKVTIDTKSPLLEEKIRYDTNTPKKKRGAPLTKFDRVYAAKQSVKLSALTNATSAIMVEKYETNMTKDELLRKALNEYIKQNLSLEDKQDLLNSVLIELDFFREKYPIIPEVDDYNKIIRTSEEIKDATLQDMKNQWGIKNRS